MDCRTLTLSFQGCTGQVPDPGRTLEAFGSSCPCSGPFSEPDSKTQQIEQDLLVVPRSRVLPPISLIPHRVLAMFSHLSCSQTSRVRGDRLLTGNSIWISKSISYIADCYRTLDVHHPQSYSYQSPPSQAPWSSSCLSQNFKLHSSLGAIVPSLCIFIS